MIMKLQWSQPLTLHVLLFSNALGQSSSADCHQSTGSKVERLTRDSWSTSCKSRRRPDKSRPVHDSPAISSEYRERAALASRWPIRDCPRRNLVRWERNKRESWRRGGSDAVLSLPNRREVSITTSPAWRGSASGQWHWADFDWLRERGPCPMNRRTCRRTQTQRRRRRWSPPAERNLEQNHLVGSSLKAWYSLSVEVNLKDMAVIPRYRGSAFLTTQW